MFACFAIVPNGKNLTGIQEFCQSSEITDYLLTVSINYIHFSNKFEVQVVTKYNNTCTNVS